MKRKIADGPLVRLAIPRLPGRLSSQKYAQRLVDVLLNVMRSLFAERNDYDAV